MRFRANNHTFLFKQIMKHRTIKEPVANFPAFLADKEIADPRKKLPKFPKWKPEIENARFMRPLPVEDVEGYREQCIYEYTQDTLLHDGEKQSLVLTKTHPYYELPKSISDRYGQLHVKDMKQLVKEIIMQSHIWDGTSEKLPRRYNKDLPGWRMKAEIGIPKERITSSMYQKLLRLCESSLVCEDFSTLTNRSLSTNNYASTQFNYNGKVVEVKGECDFLLSSSKSVPNHSVDQSEISSTENIELPSLFPISPLINLRRQHIYETGDVSCWKENTSCSKPHTLFLSVKDTLGVQDLNAKAIMTCFSHTLNHAKQTYGADVKTLPEPVSTQCVLSDGVNFQFYCFQLNTVDVSSPGGVKNQVWIDNGNALFRKLIPKRSMLRNTKYEDFDEEVIKKFVALYANGADI